MERGLKWLNQHLEEVILVLLLMLMALIMSVQIFCRYVLNNSLSWSEELVRYMFVWTTFLGVSYSIKENISIKIDALVEVLPKDLKQVVYIISDIIVILLCVMMTFYSYRYLKRSIDMAQVSAALELPMKFIQSSPFVGFLFASFRSAQSVVNNVRGLMKKDGKEVDA